MLDISMSSHPGADRDLWKGGQNELHIVWFSKVKRKVTASKSDSTNKHVSLIKFLFNTVTALLE